MEIDIQKLKSTIDTQITQSMTDAKIPGVGISIMQGEETIYTRGYGSRNKDKFQPYTADTLNGFGSCTKSMTAMAILMLVEEGKLDLHDHVSKHIPQFTLGKRGFPITIHHLLSQSSGIPNLGAAELILSMHNPDNPFPNIPFSSWDDFYYHINGGQNELFHNPGDHFFYCNSGYTILGDIISAASGESYVEFIKNRILIPLEMNRSSFLEQDVKGDDNLSIPYEPSSGQKPIPEARSFPYNKFIFAPGGLISSPNEMNNYLQMMVQGGTYKGKSIVSLETIEKLTTGYITPTLNRLIKSKYGYGWIIIEDFFGDKLISHGGGITGGFSNIAYLKQAKFRVSIISNYPSLPPHILYNIFAILLGKDLNDISQEESRMKHLSKLSGDYQSYSGMYKSKIINKDGQLFLETEKPKSSIALIPETKDDECMTFYFNTPIGPMNVPFRKDDGGKYHFTIERNSFHQI